MELHECFKGVKYECFPHSWWSNVLCDSSSLGIVNHVSDILVYVALHHHCFNIEYNMNTSMAVAYISVLSLWSYVTQFTLPAIQQSQRPGVVMLFIPAMESFYLWKIFSVQWKNCLLKVPSYGLVWMHFCREQDLRIDLHTGKYPFRGEIDENCNCWKFNCLRSGFYLEVLFILWRDRLSACVMFLSV